MDGRPSERGRGDDGLKSAEINAETEKKNNKPARCLLRNVMWNRPQSPAVLSYGRQLGQTVPAGTLPTLRNNGICRPCPFPTPPRGHRLFWVRSERICRRQGAANGQCGVSRAPPRRVGNMQGDGNRKRDESLRSGQSGRRGVDDTSQRSEVAKF